MTRTMPRMMSMAEMPAAPMGMPTMPMMPMNMMMVPQCTMKMEKCPGGMMVSCICDDQAACAMIQNLAPMLSAGMCSFAMTMNGLPMMQCNMMMGKCKCEMMDMGMKVTCTSGDPDAMKMIQACCDCMSSMLAAGCCCCMMMNNTPVCCGTC